MNDTFIHLHLHSEYSLVDSIIQIDDLIGIATKTKIPAIAITDLSNLFATIKFYQAARAKGIKPIIGSEILLHNEAKPKEPFRLVLLCQNMTGYRNLTRLVSKAYIEGQQQGKPIVLANWLITHAEGLIALSCAQEGDIGQAILNDRLTEAESLLHHWCQLFPDRFYLEIQRVGQPNEEHYIDQVINLALKTNTPVVASNNVRFLKESEFDAHEARVCIQEGYTLGDPKRPHLYTAQQYLRSQEEMTQLFDDIPEALANSIEIAKRCNLHLVLGKPYLPQFPIPSDMTIETLLTTQTQKGLAERLKNTENHEVYQQRLTTELDVIHNMGFAGYFLIVADFIQWAKQNKIPVGPGRGSGAGSLVAYTLGITDLDPLQYDLLFERFLNPERISMPDFDIDFCMEGRDRVIQYVEQKYGRQSVCQIITFGTMAARAVVRDVGRVLAHPYGFVDKIAKLIPFELGITLEKALASEEELKQRYNQEEEVKTLLDLAQTLEGVARNAGKHAGGVVIAPSNLTDFVPLYCEASGEHIVTQFDKDDVESVGLVKFDFLGLRTLTIIDWALETVNEQRHHQQQSPIDITSLPTDDVQTYELIKSGLSTAVFQLESRGMKELTKRLQPDCFEEIIALVALYRPGPLQSGMVDDFVNRKHGHATIEYLHPDLTSILKPTYGVILYQEQVMQIAQVLAGYTLGAADLLRRAMGKRKPEEMALQRNIFVRGATARGVTEQSATTIFDLMEKFAGYGFNKSHSAAYALLTYQTAWLKTHYPAAFMAAVLSSDMEHTDKVVALLEECRLMKLKILPPDINHSHYRFTVHNDSTLRYGLGAIKGLGFAAIETIIKTRQAGGAFNHLFDFCQRIYSQQKVNRRALEALIRAGALDQDPHDRAILIASLDKALKLAEQSLQAQQQGQLSLFGSSADTVSNENYIIVNPWTAQERLRGEKEVLGTYLSGHPLQPYQQEIAQLATARICDLNLDKNQNITLIGLIIGIRKIITKRGNRMAIITLDDSSGRIEIAVFADCYEACKDQLNVDETIVVNGEITLDNFSGAYRLSAKSIQTLLHIRRTQAKHLLLTPLTTTLDNAKITQLTALFAPFTPGNCPIYLEILHHNVKALVQFGITWKVTLTEELLLQLQHFFGENNVHVEY